jgi:hypothetical protein
MERLLAGTGHPVGSVAKPARRADDVAEVCAATTA